VGRHGYSDSCDDNWALLRWRGQVVSAIRGKRGQAFLRELIDALDAMPVKRLIPGALRKDGEVCAMGAIGAKRGVNLEALDPDDYEGDADWRWDKETPEERWARVREWAVNQLKTESQR
jgi:hypothetical protein